MRPIIRRRELVEDELRYAGEPESEGTVRVHALAEWLAHAAPRPTAVLIAAADDTEALAPHVASLRWIVIEFAKIGEGRGYSQARLLRQRYRYSHELRARGAIKRDQLFFLARCGFDAFELDAAEDPRAALAGLDTFSVAYQDGDERLVHPLRRTAVGA